MFNQLKSYKKLLSIVFVVVFSASLLFVSLAVGQSKSASAIDLNKLALCPSVVSSQFNPYNSFNSLNQSTIVSQLCEPTSKIIQCGLYPCRDGFNIDNSPVEVNFDCSRGYSSIFGEVCYNNDQNSSSYMGNCVQYYNPDCFYDPFNPNKVIASCNLIGSYCKNNQYSLNNCFDSYCANYNNQLCGYNGTDCYSLASNELSSYSQQYSNPTISSELQNLINISSEIYKQTVPVSVYTSGERIEVKNIYGKVIAFVNYIKNQSGEILITSKSQNANASSNCSNYNSYSSFRSVQCSVDFSASFVDQPMYLSNVANYNYDVAQEQNEQNYFSGLFS
jgi:hypothetical protein